MFRHISLNTLAPLKYSTSYDKKTNDFVKNWPSITNLCFEKHWFPIIFDDEKLSAFNIYLKNYWIYSLIRAVFFKIWTLFKGRFSSF